MAAQLLRARAAAVSPLARAVLLGWASVALAALAAPSAAGSTFPTARVIGDWQRPVPGRLTRAFDYAGNPLAAGRHRGVDFAARPGQHVRSACSGQVVFAGTAGSNGPTVSVRCGAWRVSYLPLHSLAVRRGARVARGARLGTTAGAGRHNGLHVGVRREGRRWAYVDPLPFFGPVGPPPVPIGPPTRPGRRPPRLGPVPAPRLPAPAPRARPAPRVPAPARHLAPWPAWAGLALVLAGASGAGASRRRRRAARLRARSEQARLSHASA